MADTNEAGRPTTVGEYVEAFERARAEGPAAVRTFLPDRQDPLYPAVLRELIRVDLEHGWDAGRPTPLEAYLADFPELAADRPGLAAVAFVEYRLRQQRGEAVSAAEYAQRHGIDTAGW